MKLLDLFWKYALTVITLAVIGGASDDSCNPNEGTCRAYTILGKPSEYTESTAGVKLAVRRWVPPQEDEIKSVILFVHGGAGWHSGYGDIMGRYMKEAGIAVVAFDGVGSGHSEGVGGLRNYFPNIDTLVNDVTMMLSKVRSEYPNKKVFAMGESFGGMVLVTQILKEQKNTNKNNLADGYLFTGPVIRVLPEMLPPKIVIKILGFVARFFPMLTMPGTDFFSTFDLAFGDKGWAQAGRNDPIIQEAATLDPKLGMISSVLSNMESMNRNLEEVNVPFKIFMGEMEGRVDVAAVKRLAEVAKSSDKEIEIVEGGYHQLFQDVPEVTEKVCQHVKEWIFARS